MPQMDIVGWIVIGLLAGALSSVVFKERTATGCLPNLVIGIAGGLIGGAIAREVFNLDRTVGFLGALAVAVLGALLVRFLIALVTPPRR
jgi:uncharacterized membrane protein YeaQ/YmgE (transglycosylase-associated protein family)